MKLSIGYRLPDERDSTVAICRDYCEHISNVYFSFADEPSGRLPLCDLQNGESIGAKQIEELKEIKRLGKTLTLLFNASCYGEGAASAELMEHVLSICKKLKSEIDFDTVTTTSPFIADVVKHHFGNSISVMASVNMRIGTARAMEQLAEFFDGFYASKECNRNFDKLRALHAWCQKRGKRLSILANSGCLPYCAYQGFHDNMVAHERLSSRSTLAWDGLPSPCHRFIASKQLDDAIAYFLSGTWIRPEDIDEYEALFEEIKLATRMHTRARSVISAYARGRYPGNLLDLTEPSFSRDLRGAVLDNTLIPNDFLSHVTHCDENCEECGYCKRVARAATIKIY